MTRALVVAAALGAMHLPPPPPHPRPPFDTTYAIPFDAFPDHYARTDWGNRVDRVYLLVGLDSVFVFVEAFDPRDVGAPWQERIAW